MLPILISLKHSLALRTVPVNISRLLVCLFLSLIRTLSTLMPRNIWNILKQSTQTYLPPAHTTLPSPHPLHPTLSPPLLHHPAFSSYHSQSGQPQSRSPVLCKKLIPSVFSTPVFGLSSPGAGSDSLSPYSILTMAQADTLMPCSISPTNVLSFAIRSCR